MKMTGMVNTAITMRINAGTIVHEISSTVLPDLLGPVVGPASRNAAR
jgi:hypothetical protein